jgi:hypothetical protein
VATHYQHLGVYSDWVEVAQHQQLLYPLATPGPVTQARVREVLGFCHTAEQPVDVQLEQGWQQNDLIGEEVSWSVGFGPRTHAYVVKPA